MSAYFQVCASLRRRSLHVVSICELSPSICTFASVHLAAACVCVGVYMYSNVCAFGCGTEQASCRAVNWPQLTLDQLIGPAQHKHYIIQTQTQFIKKLPYIPVATFLNFQFLLHVFHFLRLLSCPYLLFSLCYY